jgi:hypothetical protein
MTDKLNIDGEDVVVDPLKQARKLIEQEKHQREEACRVELGQVLEKHHCGLVMIPQPVDPLTIHISPIVRSLD